MNWISIDKIRPLEKPSDDLKFESIRYLRYRWETLNVGWVYSDAKDKLERYIQTGDLIFYEDGTIKDQLRSIKYKIPEERMFQFYTAVLYIANCRHPGVSGFYNDDSHAELLIYLVGCDAPLRISRIRTAGGHITIEDLVDNLLNEVMPANERKVRKTDEK